MFKLCREFSKTAVVIIVFTMLICSSSMYFNLVYADSVPAKERPTLIVGDDINYPPYSYLDSNGKPAGFSIDLIKAVADAMGYDVEYRLNDWDTVRSQLENNEIDLISGMFYSKEREELYKFSTKHNVTTGAVFSRNKDKISDVNQLAGKDVVVQKSDIVHEFLIKKDIGINFIEVETVYEALKLIDDKKYDYAALLKPPAEFIMKEENIQNISSSNLDLGSEDFCIAVNKENEDLIYTLNGGLQILKATGEYQVIYDKWLGVYEEKTLKDFILKYSGVIGFVLFGLLALGLWVLMLKRVVNIRTRELLESNKKLINSEEELTATNEELEASFEELMAIEEELRSHYERLLISEEELKKSEERSKAIVNAIPDLLFILNDEGLITDCRASITEEMTMPKENFIGKALKDIMEYNIAEQGYKKILKALDSNKVQSFKYDVLINGKTKYFEMRISKSQEKEVVAITRDITEESEYQQKFEYLSYRDQLTGSYNRRYFEKELARLDNDSNLPLSIVMADVNGLKLINDSFGHDKGDELLIKVANVLNRTCGQDNVISRIGGDEFVILLPKTDEKGVEDLIERVKSACENEKVVSMDISISFGWGTKTNMEEEVHEVLNNAEDSMYKRKLFEGPSMRGKTIGAIINTLHEKNVREEEHSKRVSEYCSTLAERLKFSERDSNEITNAALLHDIGKVAIAEYLLNKPGRLTSDEFNEVRRHPEIGYRILSSVNDMADMAEIVLFHHERWDGKGYPKGLKGKEIPLQARIISIADSFDAMISERSYKVPKTIEEAKIEFELNAGTQFDPELTEIFINEVINPLLDAKASVKTSSETSFEIYTG